MEGERPAKARAVVLQSYPEGLPDPDKDFKLVEEPLPSTLNQGELLVRTLYLSVDPYMRIRLRPNSGDVYFPAFPLGKPLNGGGVGQVVESNDQDWAVGDIISTSLEWRDYQVVSGKIGPWTRKLDRNSPLPHSTALGVLGMPGATAYFGLLDITHPKPGETLLVSGAAGAVGSLVGQIGLIKGCKVVGIAGSDEKIAYLKKLGFHAGINYKTTTDMRAAIREACPEGVDIYFDNVGGETSDAALDNMNRFGRISICGDISHYNEKEAVPMGPRTDFKLVVKDLKKEGFLVSRWQDRFSGLTLFLSECYRSSICCG
ncbi:Prostaglandin reductase 1 [Balamuthia mandrillaris]